MAFRLVLNKEIGWFRSIIASGVISVNRKLGHQEQKREACYNQYILICGFKGELSYGVLCGLLWVFMVLHGVLCVTSHANLLHLRGFPCRSDLRFLSVPLSIYRQNKYIWSRNELRSATRSRARIKTSLNFVRRYSPLQMSMTGKFSTILSQILILTILRDKIFRIINKSKTVR